MDQVSLVVALVLLLLLPSPLSLPPATLIIIWSEWVRGKIFVEANLLMSNSYFSSGLFGYVYSTFVWFYSMTSSNQAKMRKNAFYDGVVECYINYKFTLQLERSSSINHPIESIPYSAVET